MRNFLATATQSYKALIYSTRNSVKKETQYLNTNKQSAQKEVKTAKNCQIKKTNMFCPQIMCA